MSRIWLTAQVTCRQIARTKVFYLVIAVAALVLSTAVGSRGLIGLFEGAGDAASAYRVKAHALMTAVSIWSFFAYAMGLYFGSCAVSWDVDTRTILTVLSKPVERWEYLLGKWLGLTLFLFLYLLAGLAPAVALGRFAGVDIPAPFLVALAAVFVHTFWLGGVSLGLSALHPPLAAGLAAFGLTLVPDMLRRHMDHSDTLMRLAANLAHFVGPADAHSNRLLDSVARTPESFDPSIHLLAMAENILYAVAVFLICSRLFSRRDIQVRSA